MTAPMSLVEEELERLALDYEGAFAPECLSILDKAKQLVPLAPNSAQRLVGSVERRQIATRGEARIYALKGRQGGITTDQQGRALHLVWSMPGAVAMTLSDKREKTDKIFEITRRFIENFPRPLLPRLGGRETREIAFPGLDSHFYTETAGSGRAAAGLTLNRLHCSEFAFYTDPRAVLKAAAPAMVPVGSVVVLETTASAFGSDAHALWEEASSGLSGYEAVFIPWWHCDPTYYRLALLEPDELGALEQDELDLVSAHGLTLEQLKWRREKMREMGRAEFLQEYAEDPETCWMTAGGMFYDAELLKHLRTLAERADHQPTDVQMGGELEIYSELREGERCIIGADTAEGGGGDRSTFTARAFPSWRKLAVYRSAYVEPKEFAAILNIWGTKYNKALLVVEKNAHGITVLRELRDVHDYPLHRIYHRQVLDADRAIEGEQVRLGWVTTKESLPLLLDAGRELLNAARDGYAEAPSLDALRDAFGVHRGDDGKISLNGKDVLVSEMLAWIGRSMPMHTLAVA